MKYCSNCGAQLDDKANFCEVCGATAHENHYSHSSTRKKKGYWDNLIDAIQSSGMERKREEKRREEEQEITGTRAVIILIIGVIVLIFFALISH